MRLHEEHFENHQVLRKYLWLLIIIQLQMCNCLDIEDYQFLQNISQTFYYLKLNIAKNKSFLSHQNFHPNSLSFNNMLYYLNLLFKDIFSFSSPLPTQDQVPLSFSTSYTNSEIVFHISYSRSFIKILSWKFHILPKGE